MKQQLVTVESSSDSSFDKEVNALLKEGYEIKSTHISGREVGTYGEYSLYQAILVKDMIREVSQDERAKTKIIAEFKK